MAELMRLVGGPLAGEERLMREGLEYLQAPVEETPDYRVEAKASDTLEVATYYPVKFYGGAGPDCRPVVFGQTDKGATSDELLQALWAGYQQAQWPPANPQPPVCERLEETARVAENIIREFDAIVESAGKALRPDPGNAMPQPQRLRRWIEDLRSALL